MRPSLKPSVVPDTTLLSPIEIIQYQIAPKASCRGKDQQSINPTNENPSTVNTFSLPSPPSLEGTWRPSKSFDSGSLTESTDQTTDTIDSASVGSLLTHPASRELDWGELDLEEFWPGCLWANDSKPIQTPPNASSAPCDPFPYSAILNPVDCTRLSGDIYGWPSVSNKPEWGYKPTGNLKLEKAYLRPFLRRLLNLTTETDSSNLSSTSPIAFSADLDFSSASISCERTSMQSLTRSSDSGYRSASHTPDDGDGNNDHFEPTKLKANHEGRICCGKVFSRASNWKSHIKAHSESDYPHTCRVMLGRSFCDQKFRRKTDLNRHYDKVSNRHGTKAIHSKAKCVKLALL